MDVHKLDSVKLAETYKGNGFTPMPCFAWNHPWKSEKQRKSKRKAPGNTKWNGDDWASLTPDELVSLFEPGQNIGIRLDGDLVAIDADTTDPHELDAIRQALPLTSPICEGNRGFKAFVRSKIAPTKSIPLKSGAKIELLGNGHQAIIPPSIHPDTGRPYSVSPSPDGEKRDLGDMRLADVPEVDDVEATLRRELADWIATPSPPLNGARTRGAGEKLTRAKRGKMLDALECIPADPHYDDWLKVLAALHHHGEEEEIARAWSATCPEKYDPKEFDEKWKSFGDHPNPVTLNTLIAIAKEHDPDKYARLQSERSRPRQPATISTAWTARRTLDTVTEIDLEFIFWPYIPAGKFIILAGKGESAKGTLLVDWAARVTRGDLWPCSEERAPRKRVLWIEAEDDLDDTLKPRLIAAGADLTKIEAYEPHELPSWQEIGDRIRGGEYGLIIISPLVEAMKGLKNINAENDVRTALQDIRAALKGQKCSVIGIAHTRKEKEVDVAAVETVLGSVAFVNFTRSLILVRREAKVTGDWKAAPGEVLNEEVFRLCLGKEEIHCAPVPLAFRKPNLRNGLRAWAGLKSLVFKGLIGRSGGI